MNPGFASYQIRHGFGNRFVAVDYVAQLDLIENHVAEFRKVDQHQPMRLILPGRGERAVQIDQLPDQLGIEIQSLHIQNQYRGGIEKIPGPFGQGGVAAGMIFEIEDGMGSGFSSVLHDFVVQLTCNQLTNILDRGNLSFYYLYINSNHFLNQGELI